MEERTNLCAQDPQESPIEIEANKLLRRCVGNQFETITEESVTCGPVLFRQLVRKPFGQQDEGPTVRQYFEGS